MAIVFDKDLAVDKLLFAYNNNTIKFHSDDLIKIPKSATIVGLGIDALLLPHPDGSFKFNFKDDIKASINTKNFIDDFDYTINPNNPLTQGHNVTDGFYIEGNVDYKITYTNDSEDAVSKNYKFIAGVENLETYKKGNIKLLVPFGQLDILSPVKNRVDDVSGDDIFLKYWEGYPFDFSFYKGSPAHSVVMYVTTPTSSIDFGVDTFGDIISFYICDGLNESTYIGLQEGINIFDFEVNGVTVFTKLNLLKVENECGVYVKFLNKYGRYNYWLFSKNYFRNRSSKYLAELENDFKDLEETISTTLQIGKNSDSTIKCAAKNLTENEKLILEEIIDSNKILLFTGEPGTVSTNNDWMEVKLKTTNFQTESPNKKLFSFYLEFDLPARNTIIL